MRRMTLGLAVGAVLVSGSAMAQSTSAVSIVGVNNAGYIAQLDRQDTNGTLAQAHVSRSFTGLDGFGNQQTMDWEGTTRASAEFGRLHCFTSGTVHNTYYNENNPAFADMDGNVINENGSPTTLTSLGFAFFTDTLQFGGNLQSGYKARYIFHVDGTNSGDGALADLGVTVDNNPSDTFFAFETGSIATNWATSDYDVNGQTPQQINVQFSTQVVFDLYNYPDGSNLSGTSDFSATVTLADIELVDANGNYATGWTVTSGSGTTYNTMGAVPEPASLTVLGLALPAFLARRRKR